MSTIDITLTLSTEDYSTIRRIADARGGRPSTADLITELCIQPLIQHQLDVERAEEIDIALRTNTPIGGRK